MSKERKKWKQNVILCSWFGSKSHKLGILLRFATARSADQTERTWNTVANFTPSGHVYSSMLPTECFISLLISIRLQKAINGITDSNENQTIILKTWFQDYLPLKTWTFPCKYMIGVLCYGSSLIKTLRWLAGLSGLQVTQDWKRKEKRIEIFNKM